MFCLEFSGLHYCLFVKVPFFLLEVFPEELLFLSLRQLIEFIISSSVCQELFSFCFQVPFETRLLITRSNSSVVYQNLLFVSSSFFIFFSKMITAAFTVGLQYSILPFPVNNFLPYLYKHFMLSQQCLVIWDKKRSPEIRILFFGRANGERGI